MAIKVVVPQNPAQGEVWEANLDPTMGREQSGHRPVLVVSDDSLNRSARELLVVAPITGTARGFPTHIEIRPPEGGLSKTSVVMTEQLRSISKSRLIRRRGSVSPETLNRVKNALRLVLDL